MANDIYNLMIQNGPPIYYDEKFRTVLETHLSYLRTHPSTAVFELDPHDAYKHEGDFFGLLLAMNQPAHLHWIIMRVNFFTSPTEMTQDFLKLMIPANDVIENIRRLYMVTHKIS